MSAINTKINILLVAAGAFAGGLAIGLMLTPRSGRDNRKWILSKKGRFSDWINDKGNRTGKKVQHFASNLEKSVHDTLPDLYSATENLHLKDDDLMN